MPQTSLTGWLSKPVALSEPAPVKQSIQLPIDDGISEHPATLATPSRAVQDVLSNGNSASSIGSLREKHPPPPNVERLNSLLLPIPYPEKFYGDITDDAVTHNISLVAVWHDDQTAAGKEQGRLVGAIRCRLLEHPPASKSTSVQRKEGPMLYLSTLVLLSPYRSHGIASRMLDILTRRAIENYGISSVGAHVWEANSEGLEWYRKRGFREVGSEPDYYRRLKPATAVVMLRDVGVRDLMDG
ncbi:hypothetical protein LTR37_002984 [Vermiconidia calcicola]|uniref:Uncharacterized protein n=1 Tax=Vermiconidia calcicola TaxID=1690605 RepID=A0ACC3NSR9_9PEZI|nr:hypothetical protein LTR37_002984 [Vermiconidia calcicola]